MRTLNIIVLMAALASCSYNPNDYSAFADVDSDGWADTQTFVFDPVIGDSIAEGQLSLLVRHTNDYPYSNLWVELETTDRKDTLCIDLADIYGNWYGTGTGTSYQLRTEVLAPYTLKLGEPLRLRHVMRPQLVSGLEQIGIIFDANEQ